MNETKSVPEALFSIARLLMNILSAQPISPSANLPSLFYGVRLAGGRIKCTGTAIGHASSQCVDG